MKTWVRKTLSVGVLAAGALLFAPGAAQADVYQDTSGNVGILNGTQVFAPIAVPLNVVGNSIGVAGEANSAGSGINVVESGKKGNRGDRGRGGKVSQHSSGNFGIANGTQVYLPISVPVNVAGNSAAVLGLANASGVGVNHVESTKTERRRGGDQDTSGNFGVLNGTQVYAPIDVPINLCGNALSILGLAQSQAACVNGGRRESVSQDSSDNVGVLNGTQLAAPISIPINACGNALAVLGLANSAAACANDVDGDRGHGHGHGNNGTGGDNGHGHDGNGADNGNNDDDDDYIGGDHGDQGYDDDDVAGDGDVAGDDDAPYGKPARKGHAKSATEAGGVDGLTQNLSNAGGLNVGGLTVLDKLGK